MGGNNLQVKVSADIVSLQIEFAKAKANTADLQKQLNALAKESQNGPMTEAQATRMQKVSEQLAASRDRASELAGKLKELTKAAEGEAPAQAAIQQAATQSAEGLSHAGEAAQEMAGHVNRGHGAISTATREFRALFDELSSGRVRMMPGTLAIIASSVFGLSPAALAATGGIGLLAAGLGYLAYRALEASRALNQMKMGRDLADNIDLSVAGMQSLVDQMAKSADISKTEARKIGQAIFSIPGITEEAATAVATITPRFASAFGVEADKMPEIWDKLLSPGVSAESALKVLSDMHADITTTQRQMADAADTSGNANEVLAAKLETVGQVLNRTAADQIEKDGATTRSFRNVVSYIALEKEGLDGEQELLDISREKWVKQSEAIDAATQSLRNRPTTADQDISVGLSIAKKENPVGEQIAKAEGEVQQLTRALDAARTAGNSIAVDRLSGALDAVKEKLNSLQMGPVLERMRTGIQEVAGEWEGSQTQMLIKQREVARASLAEVQEYVGGAARASKEYLTVTAEISRLTREIRRSESQDAIQETQRANQEISADTQKTKSEQLTEERANLQRLLDDNRVFGSQRTQVEREVAADTVAISHAVSEELLQQTQLTNQSVAADSSKTRVQQLTEERANLQQLLDDQRISGAQRVQIRREVAQDTVAIDRQTQAIQRQIDRSDVDTDISIERMRVEAKRESLQSELTARRSHAEEVYSQLREMTQHEFELDIQRVENERGQDGIAEADYARLTNKIRTLKEQLNLDLAKLDREATSAARREAEQQAQAWKGFVGEVESSEGTMLQSLLAKRSTFGKAALQLVGKLADEEIANDAKAVTTRLLIQDREIAGEKAQEQGGLAYHLLTQHAKTGQKAAGAAERTAVSRGESAADASSDTASELSSLKKESVLTGQKTGGASIRKSLGLEEAASDQSSDLIVVVSGARKESVRTEQRATGAATRETLGRSESVGDAANDAVSAASGLRKEAARTSQRTAGVATRNAVGRTEVTADVADDTVSLSSKIRAEAAKIAHKLSGVITRKVLGKSEATADVVDDATSTSSAMKKESATTAATTAGTSSRRSIETSADTTSVAQTIATGASIIMAYAAEAAAAAGASVAAIPYFGWAMVPETMATTYGEVMGYMGALDKGAWEVPGTGLATLHPGESVVPKDFASGLRSSGALGTASQSGDTYGDFNQTNHFHNPMPSAVQITKALNDATRAGHPAAMKLRRR